MEKRIVAALGNGKVAANDLEALIAEVQISIEQANADAQQERDRAVNIVEADAAEAAKRVAIAELKRDRLKTALPRVTQRLQETLQREYADNWLSAYTAQQPKRDALAKELAAVYQEATNKLIDLFQRMEECDAESSRIDGQAPVGEPRRLGSVELKARKLDCIRTDQSVTKATHLIDWNSGREAWPLPQPSIAQICSAIAVPQADRRRYGPDWWQALEEDNAIRAETTKRRQAVVRLLCEVGR